MASKPLLWVEGLWSPALIISKCRDVPVAFRVPGLWRFSRSAVWRNDGRCGNRKTLGWRLRCDLSRKATSRKCVDCQLWMFWAAFVDYELFCHQILKGLNGKQHQTTVGACRNERVKKSTIVLANLEPILFFAYFCFTSLLSFLSGPLQAREPGLRWWDRIFWPQVFWHLQRWGNAGWKGGFLQSVIRFFDVYTVYKPSNLIRSSWINWIN